jgi:hypothetical protein
LAPHPQADDDTTLKSQKLALLAILISGLVAAATVVLNQLSNKVVDLDYEHTIKDVSHPTGQGPTVLVDASHHNHHKIESSYQPFANLLRADGYIVNSTGQTFEPAALNTTDVLVIASARRQIWPDQVAIIKNWVIDGGSLLLVVDHQPYTTPSIKFASEFGIELLDGTALYSGTDRKQPIVFSKKTGTLTDHSLLEGIETITTFSGTSFELNVPGEPLLIFTDGAVVNKLLINKTSSNIDASGQLQGAVLKLGNGKVAVFSEAGMFTAQLSKYSRQPMGMNHPSAADNASLLLNVMRWLSSEYKTVEPTISDSAAP